MILWPMKSYVRKQVLVALCVYIGKMVLSLCRTYPDDWLLNDPEKTPLADAFTTEDRLLTDFTLYFGMWIGAGIFGFISNTWGRKPCFFLSGIICFCSHLLLTRLKSIYVLLGAKFIGGLGSGIIYVNILVYLGEIASTDIRGFILTFTYVFEVLQSFFDILNDNNQNIPFYTMTYYGLIISAVFLLATFYIPESPVFFTLKGSNEQLEKSLTSLGRQNELDSMISTKLELATTNKTHVKNWLEIFTVKSNRNALFIVMTLNILQNLSGSMGILYFTPKLIEPDLVSLKVTSIIITVCNAGGVLVSLALLEKVGRKTLLMMSIASCGLSLTILSTFLIIDRWMPSFHAWIYVILIILSNYFFSYSMGFRTIPEILIGEMFTPNVRSMGSAFVIFASTFLEYLVVWFSYLILKASGFHLRIVFVVYCLSNVIAFFFTLFLVPETKGMTLSEINEMMKKKKTFEIFKISQTRAAESS